MLFFQQGVQPVYQFEVFEDSGLLPPGSMGNVTLDFQALGTANISIDDADLAAFIMDPTLPIPLAAVTGTFFGEMPAGTVAPEGTPFTLRALELVSGQLENVTVDGMGNISLTGESNSPWGISGEALQEATNAFAVQLNSKGMILWNTFLQ